MMVDLEQVINSLIDGSLLHKRKIEKMEGDMKRAFDEIEALRRALALAPAQSKAGAQ